MVLTVAEAALSTTSSGGTYGGVMVGVRTHFASQPMDGDFRRIRAFGSQYRDFVVRKVPLKAGRELLIACCYARHGDVAGLFRDIAQLTCFGSVPFLLLHDFNIPLQELPAEYVALLKHMKASVVIPRGGLVTCHQEEVRSSTTASAVTSCGMQLICRMCRQFLGARTWGLLFRF